MAWGQRKRFADGKVTLPYKQFLGYERGEDGIPQIVEKEAEIVVLIYRMFLDGKSSSAIAKFLTAESIPTPGGKKNWQPGVVKSILTNEKYKGDAILQKGFTVDFLTKKRKVNEGEVPQYYIENSHPAIIRPEVFEMVQEEFRRRTAGGVMINVSILSGRIVCGDCGGFYGRKVWHAGSSYATTVWQCNRKFREREYCSTPSLKEDAIKKAFVDAFNSLLEKKAEILANYEACLDDITDDSEYRKETADIDSQCSELVALIERLVAVNARTQVEQSDFNQRYNDCVAQYDALQKRRKTASEKIAMCAAKRVQVSGFLSELEKHKASLEEFDDRVWQATLNQMKVLAEGHVVFVFRDGTELPWMVECGVRKYDGKKHP